MYTLHIYCIHLYIFTYTRWVGAVATRSNFPLGINEGILILILMLGLNTKNRTDGPVLTCFYPFLSGQCGSIHAPRIGGNLLTLTGLEESGY